MFKNDDKLTISVVGEAINGLLLELGSFLAHAADDRRRCDRWRGVPPHVTTTTTLAAAE